MTETPPSFKDFLQERMMYIKQEPGQNMAQYIDHIPRYTGSDPQSFMLPTTYNDVFTENNYQPGHSQQHIKQYQAAEADFKTAFSTEWPPSFGQASTSTSGDWLLNSSFVSTAAASETLDPQTTWLSPVALPDYAPSNFTSINASQFEAGWPASIQESNSTLSASSNISSVGSFTNEASTPASIYSNDNGDDWFQVSNANTTQIHAPVPIHNRNVGGSLAAMFPPLPPPSIPVEPTQRAVKDNMLLSMRRQGFSYREIKRIGKFSEADSTLRGRVRTLTKDKKDRVRKPVWHRRDELLLKDAVRRHRNYGYFGRQKSNDKIPWKKIAEWMYEQGGSYHFASATCAKKWEEMQESN